MYQALIPLEQQSYDSTTDYRMLQEVYSLRKNGLNREYERQSLSSLPTTISLQTTLASSDLTGTLCFLPGCGKPSRFTPFLKSPAHVDPPKWKLEAMRREKDQDDAIQLILDFLQ